MSKQTETKTLHVQTEILRKKVDYTS